jgi:hypothetical protein
MAEKAKYTGQKIALDNILAIGHYTQVMWKSTIKVGCGKKNGFLVCKYFPSGNIAGMALEQS